MGLKSIIVAIPRPRPWSSRIRTVIASSPAAPGRYSVSILALAGVVLLIAAPVVPAQSTWTGNSSNLWTDVGNWSAGVPDSGTTALFNAASPNTAISLGGGAQPVGSVQFDTAGAASYTVGAAYTGSALSGDQLNVISNGVGFPAGGGAVAVTSTVTSPQTIGAALSFQGAAPFITNNAATTLNLGILPAAGQPYIPLTLANGSTLVIVVSNSAAVVNINDSIQGNATVTLQSDGNLGATNFQKGTIVFNGQSTFSGGFNQLSPSGVIMQVGTSSIVDGSGQLVSGPFGTGPVTFNNSSNSPLQAVGADQSIANAVVLSTGCTISNASTPHNLTFSGPFTYPSTTSRTVSVNTPGQAVFLGTAPNSSTITLSATTALNLAFDPSFNATGGNSILVINDTIRDNPSPPATANTVSYNSLNNTTPMGLVRIAGANSYSGNTTLNGPTSALNQLTVEIASSSVGSGATSTGPFGKSTATVITNAANAPPIFVPFGADQTVANAITMTSGFFVATAPITGTGPAVDPTGVAHNLTFTGNVANAGKVLTNNMNAGVAFYLGSAPGSGTMTLTGAPTFQSQVSAAATAAGAGTTVINDNISGAFGMTIKNGANVVLAGTNTYSGTTTVTGGRLLAANTAGSGTGSGPVNVTGTGGVGSGGLVGGTGTITGLTTLSSATAGSQGGTVSPGMNNGTPGTLNVGSMVWNPNAQYLFLHSATSNAVGGTTNDLVNGAGTLDLSNLLNSGPMTINLVPTNFSATPTQMDYTIATFAGGIFGAGGVSTAQFANGADVSPAFTLAGAYTAAPSQYATILGAPGGPQSLVITATPVPEPAAVLAACGAAFAGLTWWRRKRAAGK
jgi:fibronectin-binding autotransporter adhesin